MARPLHLIYQPTVATTGFYRDRRMRRQPCQKLAVKLPIMCHAQRLTGMPFLIHRHKHGKLLVSVTSDKLFHIAAAPPCAWGLLAVYSKLRCSAFIAALTEVLSRP